MRSIKQIIELIKQHCGVEKDKDVAKALKMNPPALSNHKRRGTIPFDDLASFCHEEGLPLDWFLNNPNPESKPVVISEEAEESMWKDKYIEEMELNKKLHLEISSLKDKLLGKQLPLAGKTVKKKIS